MINYTISEYFDSHEKINIGKGTFQGQEPEHIHEFIEMAYIFSGHAVHKFGENSYNVSRGDLIFINFQQSHSIICTEEMEYVNILVLPSFISKELINSENAVDMLALSTFEEFSGEIEKIMPLVHFDGKNIIEIEKIINDMLIEFNEKKIGYQSALKGLLQVLLAKVFRQMHNCEESVGVLEHISKITPEVLQYIEENCFEKFSRSELARRSFYNPSYFCRVFKECYGTTLTSYIQHRRIEEAIKLLKTTNLSVEKICQSVGYNDKKQFYKNFKELTGTSPGKFRRSLEKV